METSFGKLEEESIFDLEIPSTSTRMCREKDSYEDLRHSDNVFRAIKNSMPSCMVIQYESYDAMLAPRRQIQKLFEFETRNI